MSTLREDFEALPEFVAEPLMLERGYKGEYFYVRVQAMWEGYQAATERAAKACEQLAVDAPFIEGHYSAMECVAAIRSGGEGGKP